jgi:hypothetical protein
VQARELVRLGCTYAQGYLFSRPLSTRAVEELLVANRPLGPKKVRPSDPAVAAGDGLSCTTRRRPSSGLRLSPCESWSENRRHVRSVPVLSRRLRAPAMGLSSGSSPRTASGPCSSIPWTWHRRRVRYPLAKDVRGRRQHEHAEYDRAPRHVPMRNRSRLFVTMRRPFKYAHTPLRFLTCQGSFVLVSMSTDNFAQHSFVRSLRRSLVCLIDTVWSGADRIHGDRIRGNRQRQCLQEAVNYR